MNINKKNKIRERVFQEKKHWVRLTRVCNNNCIFCLDKDVQNGEIFPFKEILKDLKGGIKKGATRAILSGGEPTLHPQIVKIVKMAKNLGYKHIQLITNGRMLAYENLARELKTAGLDEITFSLHSHIKKIFEQITQVKGSYWQSLKGLTNALKNNFIVSIDIVINKLNLKTLRKTIEFFIKFGVTEFDLLHLIPFGNAWKNKEKIFYTPPEAKKYLKKVFELDKNENLFLWTNRMPSIYLEGYEQLIQHPFKLIDEIKNREKGFKNYLKNSQFLFCYGKRCQYCFLNDFCQDIIELKIKKRLIEKSLPPCLTKNKKNFEKKLKKFQLSEKFNLEKFANFFIKYRYFVKSERCQKCKYNLSCQGSPIEKIRKEGFKILIPQK